MGRVRNDTCKAILRKSHWVFQRRLFCHNYVNLPFLLTPKSSLVRHHCPFLASTARVGPPTVRRQRKDRMPRVRSPRRFAPAQIWNNSNMARFAIMVYAQVWGCAGNLLPFANVRPCQFDRQAFRISSTRTNRS